MVEGGSSSPSHTQPHPTLHHHHRPRASPDHHGKPTPSRPPPTDEPGVGVAQSARAPPRPIPHRVVPPGSAGEYCAGNCVGGEAVAPTPDSSSPTPTLTHASTTTTAGWSSGSSLGS